MIVVCAQFGMRLGFAVCAASVSRVAHVPPELLTLSEAETLPSGSQIAAATQSSLELLLWCVAGSVAQLASVLDKAVEAAEWERKLNVMVQVRMWNLFLGGASSLSGT